ncbi:hypothetical protein [Deinococcus sedimenti]|uniref:Uncharacterized protein n=1 Tax=Deinococcus sedimenti TaxID=1867090 RepID=A0ABQ2RYJ5_9DEIO|nr:hypothetical protein [Deinococcus sedimenti]GGR81034.1 hypothetical protein GCM10008960_04920 [Deinococcus sedimenti]
MMRRTILLCVLLTTAAQAAPSGFIGQSVFTLSRQILQLPTDQPQLDALCNEGVQIALQPNLTTAQTWPQLSQTKWVLPKVYEDSRYTIRLHGAPEQILVSCYMEALRLQKLQTEGRFDPAIHRFGPLTSAPLLLEVHGPGPDDTTYALASLSARLMNDSGDELWIKTFSGLNMAQPTWDTPNKERYWPLEAHFYLIDRGPDARTRAAFQQATLLRLVLAYMDDQIILDFDLTK